MMERSENFRRVSFEIPPSPETHLEKFKPSIEREVQLPHTFGSENNQHPLTTVFRARMALFLKRKKRKLGERIRSVSEHTTAIVVFSLIIFAGASLAMVPMFLAQNLWAIPLLAAGGIAVWITPKIIEYYKNKKD